MDFSELQPVLQSLRNISSNLGSTDRKSVVFGSSLNTDYLHLHSIASNSLSPSPHSLLTILSDSDVTLQLRLVVSYMPLLLLKTSSPVRSIVRIAKCCGYLWPLTHKAVLPLRLLLCPLEACWCHYRISVQFRGTLYSLLQP